MKVPLKVHEAASDTTCDMSRMAMDIHLKGMAMPILISAVQSCAYGQEVVEGSRHMQT